MASRKLIVEARHWREDEVQDPRPGIFIRRRRGFLWIPMSDAVALADQLIDIIEHHDTERDAPNGG